MSDTFDGSTKPIFGTSSTRLFRVYISVRHLIDARSLRILFVWVRSEYITWRYIEVGMLYANVSSYYILETQCIPVRLHNWYNHSNNPLIHCWKIHIFETSTVIKRMPTTQQYFKLDNMYDVIYFIHSIESFHALCFRVLLFARLTLCRIEFVLSIHVSNYC